MGGSFVRRKNGGLLLILLSIMALPVGGGFAPPLLGTIAGIAGTKIDTPLTWWRTHLSLGARRFLAAVWPLSFGVCLVAWLLMFPGSLIIWYLFPETDPNLMFGLILIAFASLLATVVLAFAHDSQTQATSPQAPG